MNLQIKIFLSITGLLILTVAVTAVVTTGGATQAMLAQMEADGVTIARLLAHSSFFALRVPEQMEHAIGEQMVVEAHIAAHLVAVAEARAGMSHDAINRILQDITRRTALDEIWITDALGHAYLRSQPEIDFTFSADPNQQPQASVFYQLLQQENGVVIQQARQREIDPRVFKYVGVSGVEQPRIVQVGYEADFVEALSQEMNVQKLVDALTGQGNVASIRIVDRRWGRHTVSTTPVRNIGLDLNNDDLEGIQTAVSTQEIASTQQGASLRVIVPLLDSDGNVQVVALVHLLTGGVETAIRTGMLRSALVSVGVIALGALLSFLLSRTVTRPVRQLAGAAQAIERGEPFQPERLTGLTRSRDELAHLARVFSRMATEVQAREAELKQQVAELRLEMIEIDEAKKERQVEEITETEYFQRLQEHARQMRRRAKGE